MRGLDVRPLALHLGPRVGEVALHVLGVAGGPDVDAPLAALLHAPQDVVLHLQVPGVVVLAGLQHRARGGGRVAAPLHLDGVEERAVGHVIGGVRLPPHRVARLEVDEAVRSGPDRLQVGGRLAALGPPERVEDMLGENSAAVAAEGIGPERLGLVEGDLDGVAVDPVDLRDLVVGAAAHRGGGRVGDELVGEDHVVGGDRLAVVPGHALLEAPRDRGEIASEPAVLHARGLRGQDRDHVAVGIEAGQRLVEDPGGVLVLGAGREVRVEQRGRLPPEGLEQPAPAALRGGERGRLGLGVRHPGRGQHLGREGGGEPQPDHGLDEGATVETAGLDVRDQLVECVMVHGILVVASGSRVRGRRSRRRRIAGSRRIRRCPGYERGNR